MIPSALAGQLQRGLADFLRFSFWSSTPGMEHVIEDLLAQPGGLLKGPYASLKLPFVPGKSATFFPSVPLPFTPHAHQEQAFERLSGPHKRSTLVATGTGSGKTESFLLPILDHCLQDRGNPGIKAILIYPMNALATDQAKRIAELIHGNDRLRGTVRAGLYIGESQKKGKGGTVREMSATEIITARDALQANPPDILLTNYKMLDLLLLRPTDQRIWGSNSRGTLRFLVVDELHTFDGAQGTDLACLIRRLKRRLQVDDGSLCCVGTSATLGGGSAETELRSYAGQVFGESFDEQSVVTESRITVREFLGDAVVEWTDEPTLADLPTLDAARAEDPDAWLRDQVRLWFGEVHDAPDPDAWAVELGSRLLRHATFRALVDTIRSRTRSVDDLAAAMARARTPWREEPALARASIASLLALASAARIWRAELPERQLQREAAGKARPTDRFLDVRLQLWQREMSRMVATVGKKPELRFSDDLDRVQKASHLPVVHCRDCGAMGWATRIDRDASHVLRTDFSAFYRGFFGKDPRVVFLFPAASAPTGDPEWEKARRYRVDAKRLTELGDDEEIDGEVVRLVAPPNTRSLPKGRELHRDCPFCGARDSLALVGFRAATLTSVYVDQIFASRFNEDKKLLTFSDSVQDASHRAGFFGARTWRTNLRIAMVRLLLEHDGLTLAELGRAMGEAPTEAMDRAAWLASFIAPDMLWLHDWGALEKRGTLPPGSDLLELVAKRLAYEVVTEFGLQSNIGRSLPRTRAATAMVDAPRLDAAVARLLEPVRNELPGMRGVTAPQLRAFLVGLLHTLRQRGGVHHAELPERYIESGGATNFDFKMRPHLPSFGRSSRMPAFLADRTGTARFDSYEGPSATNWYARWVDRCFYDGVALAADASSTYDLVLPGLVAEGLLVECRGNKNERFWGMSDEALRVTRQVTAALCGTCGHRITIGRDEATAWHESPCTTARCLGRYTASAAAPTVGPEDDYFGRLYARGDLQRIFTAEHTGLLDRRDREAVEIAFMAAEPPPGHSFLEEVEGEPRYRRPWDPNLLSCTPTLEMGINIGDLSSAFLCSVPPAQSNYLQRIGRAGRRDGNSLVLTVANARPHDQYFFALPEEMMEGDVRPPGIFLDAAAVLERQLTAYCLDRWVATATDARPAELPAMLKDVFPNLDGLHPTKFPANLLAFIEREQETLVREFVEMFAGSIGAATQEHLSRFVLGDRDKQEGLAWRVISVLGRELKQRESLSAQAKRLREEIKRMKESEAKPEDFDDQIEKLDSEKEALMALVRVIDLRHTLEFLTEEGLLPNYAFPESAVRLTSVIWRKRKQKPDKGSGYETWTHEYVRSPASALAELAPNADFYAGGRRVQIDQIDVAASTVETWRFCEACSHAQMIDTGDPLQTCPSCHSEGWRDEGQRLRMLRLQQVFANSPDRESRIRDDRDERQPRFFQRETLVDVRAQDRAGAWQLGGDRKVPFGFEYLTRATFREVNFGELKDQGAKTVIAGRAAIRPGFEICLKCGKVQRPNKDPEHALACPSRKKGAKVEMETCLYLYREFSSEALRLLLPMADLGVQRRLNSFVAALQVGLRERFGGSVDHLRTMVYTDPVGGSALRRQYLVLFDTVPGGTGYIKQLVTPTTESGQMPLFEALESAKRKLEACVCWNDPERDGCYRCLYGYRNSRDMDDTSARVAVELIGDLLKGKDQLTKIESIGNISISGLMDSVLEERFMEVLRRGVSAGKSSSVQGKVYNSKPCYLLSIGGTEWMVEPQVDVPAPEAGVKVSVDFVLHPTLAGSDRRPIAVFLDGWEYHQDRIGYDLAQRMALQASGRYDVWSFTWHDLDVVLASEPSLRPMNLVHHDGQAVRTRLQKSALSAYRDVADRPLIEVFLDELSAPDAGPWERIGNAIVSSRMSIAHGSHRRAWQACVGRLVPVDDRRAWAAIDPRSAVDDGEAEPPTDLVQFHAVHDGDRLRAVAYLDDAAENLGRAEFRSVWNGFLKLFTLLRAVPDMWFVTTTGLETCGPAYHAIWTKRQPVVDASWAAFADIGEAFVDLARQLMTAAVSEPQVGIDIPDARGDVWAEAELSWEDQRVALTSRARVEAARGKVANGWRVFVLEDLGDDAAPIQAALAAKESST